MLFDNQLVTNTDIRIADILGNLEIPKGRIIYLHVRLKNLKELLNCSYTDLTGSILKSLWFHYSPKTILIPTFTYSFTKSGVYHRIFSKSELGRFSEEVRTHFHVYRTPDPVFSVSDVSDYLCNQKINYCTAFGQDSLFAHLDKENCAIVNIDINPPVMTQIHYIEKVNNVPYRYDKNIDGIVYYDEKSWEYVNYTYYVRDLSLDPKMNLKKREKYLKNIGTLNHFHIEDIDFSWIDAKDLMSSISLALHDDERFLISE